MIRIHCISCQKELKELGGLLLSPPQVDLGRYLVHKYHVCVSCWKDLADYVDRPRYKLPYKVTKKKGLSDGAK